VSELESQKSDVLGAAIAILDINLGPNEPNGIDAYRWLMTNGFNGKILFLTGHARSSPLVAESTALGAEVMEKPVETAKLISIVQNSFQQSGA
jgi:FixJ family two-component response regulator